LPPVWEKKWGPEPLVWGILWIPSIY